MTAARLIVCDVEQGIPLASESVQCVVTSPPYFGVRDYGHGPAQIGLDDQLSDYVSRIVSVFNDVRRVLTPSGTAWLNLGDTYNTRTQVRATAHQGGLHAGRDRSWAEWRDLGLVRYSSRTGLGLKDKDLCGVPWRVAIALVDAGWYLRSEVIWRKPYGNPENAKDRPSRNHETIFLLAKRRRYTLDKHADAARTVWDIAPGGNEGPAVFPAEIPRRCILASTSPGDVVLDPFAGSGTTAIEAARLGRVGIGCDLSSEWWAA